MTSPLRPGRVSVIVPTIGRPDSLRRMLDSLTRQTVGVYEVVIADGSATTETAAMVVSPEWARQGLRLLRVAVQPRHAVRQREAAIAQASGEFLLFLDDDVELERDCVEQMVAVFHDQPSVVGAFADFSNQTWPMPPVAWRLYLRYVSGLAEGSWQGRVVGPLLRFGFDPRPSGPTPIEWLATSTTMVRRSAYDEAGGFSDFFLHRSTMNEDVDLGLKIARLGTILFCPAAKLAHFHAPGGRVSPMRAAEDDLYNRYLVMRRTQRRSALDAFRQVMVFFTIETGSSLLGCLLRRRSNGFGDRLAGRLSALGRIVFRSRQAESIGDRG